MEAFERIYVILSHYSEQGSCIEEGSISVRHYFQLLLGCWPLKIRFFLLLYFPYLLSNFYFFDFTKIIFLLVFWWVYRLIRIFYSRVFLYVCIAISSIRSFKLFLRIARCLFLFHGGIFFPWAVKSAVLSWHYLPLFDPLRAGASFNWLKCLFIIEVA